MEILVALIILLPLAGALLNGLVGLFLPAYRSQKLLIGVLSTLAIALPFAITLYLFLMYDAEVAAVVVPYYTWMAAGDLWVQFAYRIDELSLIMMLVVTGVGALIHLYSIGYMWEDVGFWRFFAYLNLFIFAMLNLVMGENLVVLFLGWEGVGLCSYLLIGFWYKDLVKSAAAMKAFIVNRIGDFAFLIAMFLLYRELGSLDFSAIEAGATGIDGSTLNWIVLLFFIGATGKSAQIPLFIWLPDAMAGPTPVSALIHAATMVTSGLYLLARLSATVLLAPGIMMVIAVVGAMTAIMAATIAITQYDIKRVLAYSTVSQLGFMFLAAGVGAFYVAIFHVFTHAFFKACLFLCSGSVIHAMHHVEHDLHMKGHKEHFDPQDMRNMGGLKKYMPSTYWTYLIATFAIAGVPLLAGFFSKDEILFKAFQAGFGGDVLVYFLWAVALVTAVLTAIYMTRSLILTFHGEERWPMAHQLHPHESPITMTIPLWVLAGLSVVAGFVGLPEAIAHGELNWMRNWLVVGGPVAEPPDVAYVPLIIEWLLIALGSAIAIGSVYFAWNRYSRYGLAYDERVRNAWRGLYRTASAKYYWDEAYEKTVVGPTQRLAERRLAPFDEHMIDGAVNGLGRATAGLSARLRHIQTGVVQNYALAIVMGVVLVVGMMILLG